MDLIKVDGETTSARFGITKERTAELKNESAKIARNLLDYSRNDDIIRDVAKIANNAEELAFLSFTMGVFSRATQDMMKNAAKFS